MSVDNSKSSKISKEFGNTAGGGGTPDFIRGSALSSVVRNSDLIWFDARGQGGPSPADLGEHLPIPDEAVVVVDVCTSDRNAMKNKEE